MKKSTKLFVLLSFCVFIVSVAVFTVFAVNQFSFTANGTIDFIIEEGLNVTVFKASLEGLSDDHVDDFQTFTVTEEDEDIQNIPGYQSWTSPLLSLQKNGDGYGRLVFTVKNNSTNPNHNIMVEMTTNTTVKSDITVTPSADFCINANDSHTFDIEFVVQDITKTVQEYELEFELTINFSLITTSEVGEAGQGMTFDYDDSYGEAELVKYTNTSQTDVVIPSIVKKDDRVYTVTSIISVEDDPDSAFYAVSSKIKSVTLPNTLVSIGDSAFLDCLYLTTANLPHSLEYIGVVAFGYSGLTGELLLPPRIESIESHSFIDTPGISGVLIIPRFVEYIGEYAFSCNTGLTGLELRDGLYSIGEGAFEDCEYMGGQLILPKGLQYINDSAFYGCNFSGDLVVPEGVRRIEINAFTWSFGGDPAVLSLPSTIEFIGYEAFANTPFTKVICYAEEAPQLDENGLGTPGVVEIYLLAHASGYDTGSNWSGYEIYSLIHF